MFLVHKIRIPCMNMNRVIKNRPIFRKLSDKANKKTNEWWEHEYMPIVGMLGTGFGTCIGSYHGYQESKKYTYPECIFMTVCFGWCGGGVGYVFTMFCPVTIPIVIVATVARQMEPVLEPEHEKKESDIYTLRDRRPNH